MRGTRTTHWLSSSLCVKVCTKSHGTHCMGGALDGRNASECGVRVVCVLISSTLESHKMCTIDATVESSSGYSVLPCLASG